MKPVRLSRHALEQLSYRGTDEYEIDEAIRSSAWAPAELGRLECRRDFEFGREWNGLIYETKQVRPIFVDEEDEIVVVTVYTPTSEEPMKITYDPQVDALYIRFREATVTTKHIGEGIAADYDGEGHLAGLEVLNAAERLGGRDTLRSAELEQLGAGGPQT